MRTKFVTCASCGCVVGVKKAVHGIPWDEKSSVRCANVSRCDRQKTLREEAERRAANPPMNHRDRRASNLWSPAFYA